MQGTGEITMVVWDRFLTHLMPRTTKEERVIYFQIASGFSNRLDVLGFMELRQVKEIEGAINSQEKNEMEEVEEMGEGLERLES